MRGTMLKLMVRYEQSRKDELAPFGFDKLPVGR